MTEKKKDNMHTATLRTEHPFYMYESLNTTPEALALILSDESLSMISDVADVLADKKRINLVGNGTSYFNALYGALALNNPGEKFAVGYPAYGFLAYPPAGLDHENAVIGISHSGTSPATVDAVDFAKSKGILTIGVSDYLDSALIRSVDKFISSEIIELNGPKTKSYVGSLLRFLLLSIELGKKDKDLSALRAQLNESPTIARQVLEENEQNVKAFAESRVTKPNNALTLVGAGPSYPNALEGALKIVETMLLHAVALEIEEAVHGNWVSHKEGELLIVFAPKGPSFEKSQILVGGMKKIGAEIWVITDNAAGVEGADFTTIIPETGNELVFSLYSILPVYQFIYYHTLKQGGLIPDRGPYGDQKFMDARLFMRSWR